MLVINRWFWPTPDEYLYAAVARSLLAGFKGEICLSCFNTEHTYLVSGLSALYQGLVGTDPFDLAAQRIPVMFFSLGTIYLLWLIAREVVKDKREQLWFVWLLLLIPGYFVLSVRFLLDVPLIFGFALLMYLLIIRTKPLLLGIALAVILLAKDYGLYLAFPLIVASFVFDLLESGKKFRHQALSFVKKTFVFLLPSVAIIMILVSFNLLPYPRLLEAGMQQYLGGTYSYSVQKVIVLLKESSRRLAQLSLVSAQKVEEVAQLSERVNKIPTNVSFPTAILDSPLKPEVSGGFARKLWLIYQYNFSEQDVMIFVLPLFLTGLVMRVQSIIDLRKRWYKARTDLLFILLAAVLFFVNWHEALNIHGFRLTAPITLALIYFSYWGARLVLLKGARLSKLIFAASFVLFAVLYANFIFNITSYGSIIANQSFFSNLLRFKLPIFMAIFLIAFVFMLVYSRLRWAKKQLMLALWILFLFTLKFTPFYLESRAAERFYEYDYGIPAATPLLQEQLHKKAKILTNVNPYTLDFYSGQLNLPNIDSYPLIRTFRQPNPIMIEHQLEKKPVDPGVLVSANVSYVLYINKSRESIPDTDMAKSLLQQQKYFSVVEEKTHAGRIQWQMYAFNKKLYLTELAQAED